MYVNLFLFFFSLHFFSSSPLSLPQNAISIAHTSRRAPSPQFPQSICTTRGKVKWKLSRDTFEYGWSVCSPTDNTFLRSEGETLSFSRGSLARDVGEKWPRPGPQPTLFSSSAIASFTRHGDRYENKYKFTECFFFGSLSLWRQLKNNSTNCTNKKNERTEHTSEVQMKGKHFFIPVPIRSRLSER